MRQHARQGRRHGGAAKRAAGSLTHSVTRMAKWDFWWKGPLLPPGDRHPNGPRPVRGSVELGDAASPSEARAARSLA